MANLGIVLVEQFKTKTNEMAYLHFTFTHDPERSQRYVEYITKAFGDDSGSEELRKGQIRIKHRALSEWIANAKTLTLKQSNEHSKEGEQISDQQTASEVIDLICLRFHRNIMRSLDDFTRRIQNCTSKAPDSRLLKLLSGQFAQIQS